MGEIEVVGYTPGLVVLTEVESVICRHPVAWAVMAVPGTDAPTPIIE